MSGPNYRKSSRARTAVIAIGLCCVTLLSACGRSPGPEIKGKLPVYPVTGQLSMGGEAMADAYVFFAPAKEFPAGTPNMRPHGYTDEEGNFRISTYGIDDGAPAGTYIVTISWKGPLVGVSGDSDERPEKVPLAFRDPRMSRLKVEIKEGENALTTWDLATVGQQVANTPR